MKKSLLLLILLSLSACAPYQTKLATPAKDQAKYKSDVKECIENGLKRRDQSDFFGPDSNKTPREMADECMVLKGYNVIK